MDDPPLLNVVVSPSVPLMDVMAKKEAHIQPDCQLLFNQNLFKELWKGGELAANNPSGLILSVWHGLAQHFRAIFLAWPSLQLRLGHFQLSQEIRRTRRALWCIRFVNLFHDENLVSAVNACAPMFENGDPIRCPVMHFRAYLSHRPAQCLDPQSPFLLQPLCKDGYWQENAVWYSAIELPLIQLEYFVTRALTLCRQRQRKSALFKAQLVKEVKSPCCPKEGPDSKEGDFSAKPTGDNHPAAEEPMDMNTPHSYNLRQKPMSMKKVKQLCEPFLKKEVKKTIKRLEKKGFLKKKLSKKKKLGMKGSKKWINQISQSDPPHLIVKPGTKKSIKSLWKDLKAGHQHDAHEIAYKTQKLTALLHSGKAFSEQYPSLLTFSMWWMVRNYIGITRMDHCAQLQWQHFKLVMKGKRLVKCVEYIGPEEFITNNSALVCKTIDKDTATDFSISDMKGPNFAQLFLHYSKRRASDCLQPESAFFLKLLTRTHFHICSHWYYLKSFNKKQLEDFMNSIFSKLKTDSKQKKDSISFAMQKSPVACSIISSLSHSSQHSQTHIDRSLPSAESKPVPVLEDPIAANPASPSLVIKPNKVPIPRIFPKFNSVPHLDAPSSLIVTDGSGGARILQRAQFMSPANSSQMCIVQINGTNQLFLTPIQSQSISGPQIITLAPGHFPTATQFPNQLMNVNPMCVQPPVIPDPQIHHVRSLNHGLLIPQGNSEIINLIDSEEDDQEANTCSKDVQKMFDSLKEEIRENYNKVLVLKHLLSTLPLMDPFIHYTTVCPHPNQLLSMPAVLRGYGLKFPGFYEMYDKLWRDGVFGVKESYNVNLTTWFMFSLAFNLISYSTHSLLEWADIKIGSLPKNSPSEPCREFLHCSHSIKKDGYFLLASDPVNDPMLVNDPARCPVYLYKFYAKHRPASCCTPKSPFFLQEIPPKSNHEGLAEGVWFQERKWTKSRFNKLTNKVPGLNDFVTNFFNGVNPGVSDSEESLDFIEIDNYSNKSSKRMKLMPNDIHPVDLEGSATDYEITVKTEKVVDTELSSEANESISPHRRKKTTPMKITSS